jgi:protein-L-isoaspartate(D-aspartate) O-methyltransferase
MKLRKNFPFVFLIIWVIFLILLIYSLPQIPLRDVDDPTTLAPSPTYAITKTPLDLYLEARKRMVSTQIEARGINDKAVLDAMQTVPRHKYVQEEYLDQAYADHPLPIGYGQTISQPYIVALMTETLELSPGDRVLEIGTGSGYQAAVLAEMNVEVYTVEIIPELAAQAEERFESQGLSNVEVTNADGYFGWDMFAPYDAIIVTAAPDHLPQPLMNQLSEGGRLVIPIGPIGAVQTLWLFEKVGGEPQAMNLGPVRFVPLTGEH